ncbi:hypothetical protein N0V85_004265 [Neurospora sp. IMI 360204]|nr:hypothetical protein N0V85_004265 [Neurospora sp. IMI 360204]
MGLRFMHQKGFLHRDLKPLNILVDAPGPEWKVKLANFGIARNVAGLTLSTLYTHYIGTYGYIAPELVFESPDAYTAAADIWALGAVVFCMYTGAPPFEQPKHLLEYRAGTRGFPAEMLGLSTGLCINFILGTMHANPRQRLDMYETMEHEWLCMDRTVSNMMSNPFNNRNELFEHLEESGHALDLTNTRKGCGPEYKRPEECRKQGRKARKAIANLEKEKA